MFDKKIIIVGGSIAGCATAILLQNAGSNVTVLEQSSGIVKQGTGVTLPFSVIKECIQMNMFDKSIPFFPATSRSFSIKDKSDSKIFWNQDLDVVTLNWMHIYENLRMRVNPNLYHSHSKVKNIRKYNDHYLIKTTDKEYEADFIIAADGSNSIVRNLILPDAIPQYSGYVAWRGVMELSENEKSCFDKHIPYFMFKNGHIVLYPIPDITYQKTRKVLLNWVLYEKMAVVQLQDLLIDKHGNRHTASLPAGSLGTSHIKYLETLINKSLPISVVNLIKKTQEPFLQVVHDFQIPEYGNENILFVGDAALTLRPHTASGVLKALKNAIDLCDLMKNSSHMSLVDLTNSWKEQQNRIAHEEVIKSNIMGLNLVINTPDWEKMDHKTTDTWWNNIMMGKNWYAIKSSDHSIFSRQYIKNVEKGSPEQGNNFLAPKL